MTASAPRLSRTISAWLLATAAFAVTATAVHAAPERAGGTPADVLFIAQLIALLAAGRLMGELMQRLGQPAVMGQLIAGVLLGPSVFGLFWPEGQHWLFPTSGAGKTMIDAVAQLGILLLLLITGMETDLALVRRVRRAALSVSIAGIALPFACGFALGEFLPATMLPKPELRLITSLFLGTALSISSVKIVAMVVREMDFLRRKVGQIIVASAIIDDTIGWVIIAITFSLALHGSIDLLAIGQTVLGAAVFLAVSFTLGRRIVSLLIRWTNDHMRSDAAVITTIIIVMGVLALATHAIGVHTVLGAFVAGVLVGQSPILTRQIDEQLRGLITGLFAPVFFGLAGLSADLTILRDPALLGITAALVAIASIGKFSGAFVGGAIGGLKSGESLALACGMNARGSTEVIVATIGLSIGALNQNLFTMIVAMAVITTLAMPPMLRWALRRLPLDDAERERLAQDEMEAAGFVTQMERLMLAAGGSSKGRFAAQLAGVVAGLRGMPVTVVPLDQVSSAEGAGTRLADIVERIATDTQTTRIPDAADRLPIDVTTTTEDADRIIATAGEKGFDFLFLGLETTGSPEGGFDAAVVAIADRFNGPLAIVATRGTHAADPAARPQHILVPVNGTDVSRRGLELALSLAQGVGASVTALYVAKTADAKRPRRLLSLRRNEDAVLRASADLAEGHGVSCETKARIGVAAEDAILRESRLGGYDLIVMGVARRPGVALVFGQVADTVLDASERSIVFVAS